jgi:hypothetical protein
MNLGGEVTGRSNPRPWLVILTLIEYDLPASIMHGNRSSSIGVDFYMVLPIASLQKVDDNHSTLTTTYVRTTHGSNTSVR